MILSAYKIASVLLTPLLWIVISYRIAKKKEDPIRYKEKFGIPTLSKNTKDLIWFHAASVGEMVALVPLIEKFHQLNYQLLITTGTVTSAKVFEKLKSKLKNCVHQFAPLDSPIYINRFLNYWQPKLGIFIESEIWPNLIVESSKRFQLALINATMSDKSFNLWSQIPSAAKFIYSRFSLIVPCSLSSQLKLKSFSESVEDEATNLKYCASPLSYDKTYLQKLEEIYTGKNILLCASTHANEEELILNVYQKMREQIPNFCLIIIPRHPNRGKEIYKLAEKLSDNVMLKSESNDITYPPSIFIVDTLGELGTFYRLAKIAFVGATLAKLGGHNIIEPAHLNCCIIIGPHYPNLLEIAQEFKRHDAVIEVADNHGLAAQVISLFQNENIINFHASNAFNLVNKENSLVEKIYNKLKHLLEK